MKQEKDKKTGVLRTVICVLCVLLLLVSGYMIVSQLVREKKEDRAFEELIAMIDDGGSNAPSGNVTQKDDTPAPGPDSVQTAAPETDSVSAPAEEEPAGFHKYDLIYEQNNDLFGWVKIEGTKLDYPVMHTPDEPERYLKRAFDQTYSNSGVPFMEGKCFEGCGNYILYGHHMKNGTMFAAIMDYADEEFWREHPVIQFDTLNEPGEYEVISAFYGKVYKVNDKEVFRYYNYSDLTDEDTFNEYVSTVKKLSRYDTGVTAEYGDQLITLITCSYHTTDGRFVVVARRTGGAGSADDPA